MAEKIQLFRCKACWKFKAPLILTANMSRKACSVVAAMNFRVEDKAGEDRTVQNGIGLLDERRSASRASHLRVHRLDIKAAACRALRNARSFVQCARSLPGERHCQTTLARGAS